MVWRYLKLQLFMLVCGVIGPIYLIGYFAFVPQADRHSFLWMFWAGLLITVADVLIAVVITRYRAKSAAKTAALEESGALALAQITGMQGTGMEIFQILKANKIPLTNPLDLRSADPDLRHQLQDVVRRAAAAQPSPAFAAGPGVIADTPGFAPPTPSAARRLQELAGLHANEAITDDEYAERRRQIISEI
jgi:hypothetical protein